MSQTDRKNNELIPLAEIETEAANRIHTVRGRRIVLDSDLAEFYGVETKALNRQVTRNADRFPEGLSFHSTLAETADLRRQNGTASWGGRRTNPRVFTEQSALAVSGALKSAPPQSASRWRAPSWPCETSSPSSARTRHSQSSPRAWRSSKALHPADGVQPTRPRRPTQPRLVHRARQGPSRRDTLRTPPPVPADAPTRRCDTGWRSRTTARGPVSRSPLSRSSALRAVACDVCDM